MTAFRQTRHGLVVEFDDVEVSLLRHLVGEVRDLLDDGRPSPAGSPAGSPTGPAAGAAAGRVPDAGELAALTGLPGGPAGRDRPADPVLARLLPDGYRDDPDLAGEFRRLTESSLRRQKSETAEALLADLPAEGAGEVRLDPATTERWLGALNDVRLALGTRLDVREEMAEPDPDDPDAPAYVVYLWLTELQGVLVEVADQAT